MSHYSLRAPLVCLTTTLASLCLSSPAAAQQDMPRVGEPFPVQQFPMIGEKGLHSIAEFRGKKVLLIQFASW